MDKAQPTKGLKKSPSIEPRALHVLGKSTTTNTSIALACLYVTHFNFYVFHQISFGGFNGVRIEIFYGCWLFDEAIVVILFLYIMTLKCYFPEKNA